VSGIHSYWRCFFATSRQESIYLPRVSLRRNDAQVSFATSIGTWEINMLKFVILGTASLALVGSAAAADLPRAQPVYTQAPVGKAPIGKAPVGKYPVGKAPAPIVTKG
jgi:hypothetical protein